MAYLWPFNRLVFGPVSLDDLYYPPEKAHWDDVGFDIANAHVERIPAGALRRIRTNVRVKLPRGTWGLLTARSSTIEKHGLLVIPGVIDPGFTGEIEISTLNISGEDLHLEPSLRLAQLIPVKTVRSGLHLNEAWRSEAANVRGQEGFGSSGK